MKKIIFGLAAASLAMASLGIVACGGDTNDDTQGGTSSYSITCEDGSNYSVTNLENEAAAGDSVSFDVESTSVFYTVGKVTMNGEELTGDMFGYSFTMPASNVVIDVTMTFVGEYDDPDDKLAWGDGVTGTIPAEGTEFNIPLSFVGISSSNWITSIKDVIYSSDESVIPSDAITFEKITASSSNAIIGGQLVVDLTKVSEGETYIYVDLDPNNSSLGTLIKKFTVLPEEDIQTMNVIFNFENTTDYATQNIFLNITDTQTEERQTLNLKDFADGSTTFEYVVGHTYTVACGYAVYNEEEGRYEDMTNLHLNEWVGTNVGGAVNELDRDSQNGYIYHLTLTTEGIEVTFTITE